MCNDLMKLGVIHWKTHTMGVPDVPNRYLGEFVRGYFDGDGNVWVGFVHKDRPKQTYVIQTGFTSCSEKFLNDLRERLLKYDVGKGSFFSLKNVYKLQYSVNDSTLLYHLMYDNLESNLFLNRKKSRF